MKAQVLTPDIQMELHHIVVAMEKKGLSKNFVAAAFHTALEFEGVYDLMKMWSEEEDSSEQGEIIADIQELIEDCSQKEKIERAYIKFDDLESIAKNIRAYKDKLREKVDSSGGVQKLSELTGIPQPSLSRFFNSNAMPRRTTLYKIAKALNLSEVDISTEWSR
jgi:DNA-binding phage protein